VHDDVVEAAQETLVERCPPRQKSKVGTSQSKRNLHSLKKKQWILYGKGIESKLSGNEDDYTNSSILLVKNMLCDTLRCQIFLIEFPFHTRLHVVFVEAVAQDPLVDTPCSGFGVQCSGLRVEG